mgnify:CR=1 FL=1|tara:strand:- start:944 stop:1222 length:279 start_codon:yes stop_codon:yes gene_type:complete
MNKKIVLVHWLDACEPDPNSDLDARDMPVPQQVWQAGFLLADNDEYIVVASGYKPDPNGAEGTWDFAITIPQGMVKGMTVLSSDSYANAMEG